jgi:hypothetical protein
MSYELIAIGIILAILGGCIAVGAAYLRRAAIAEDDLEESEDELKHVAGLMEDVKHADKTRQNAIANTRAGIVPDRLRKYYRD